MDRTQKTLTMADVAGWGSALVTFGLVQGALYLKAYWGHFGLDPFQFVAVSELALAGLAGIGMVLLFMLFAALLGGWIEGKVTADTTVSSPVMWLILVLCLAGLGAIIWWSNGWPLLIGGALVGVCAIAVRLSPVLPAAVKDSPWLVYALTMLVYVSISSVWLGSERAKAITSGGSSYTVSVTVDGKAQGGVSLVGRLGDSYLLWDPAQKLAVLVPVDDVGRLEIGRKVASPAKAKQSP
ncbi:MAG: hypothetical protein KH046_02230 [Stenotrophomonas maltophilia]|uniref:hypothetical protein n=1 Tax=Stenotrophomonas TaxID=40323 RepID=UPI00130F9C0B|nr:MULTISPECIES: hypothetical protein [Stenotrophomonas]MBS4799640.1 hypothetical protein [Stenotrophomonas maltophilia]MDG9987126.1 hypothetical protein [Stenotrophomonas sp. GD04024]